MSLLSSPIAAVSKCQEAVSAWWQWHPPIGVFISLLAIVGVLVPWFRGEAGKREKAFWTFLMFLFVGLEIRTLYLDQTQHDREQEFARCQQLESFQKIADGIDTAISNSTAQFVATMNNMGEILAKQDNTLTQTMGGTTFPMFLPMHSLDPNNDMWPVLMMTPGDLGERHPILTALDKAPLIDVAVDISEILQLDPTTKTVSAEAFESQFLPSHYSLGTVMVPETRTAPFKLQVGKNYQLHITTRRREFVERIYFYRDEKAIGGWHVSECIVQRYTLYRQHSVTGGERLVQGKCDK